MDSLLDLEQYLTRKQERRQLMFKEAASVSVLMHGVTFLSAHFYGLLDFYTWLYARFFLRHTETDTPEERAKRLVKLDADATDTYHVCWCVITFLCCWGGWYLTDREGETYTDYWLWSIPLAICVYRIFEILAALIEIYFGRSDVKHHQFRILLHAGLHYLAAGFAFALFYIFVDWQFDSFNTPAEEGDGVDYQFNEMFDPIYQSLLAVITLGVNMEPENWIGKLLVLFQVGIGMTLATFIFLNITQIWLGDKDESTPPPEDKSAAIQGGMPPTTD